MLEPVVISGRVVKRFPPTFSAAVCVILSGLLYFLLDLPLHVSMGSTF